MRRRRPPPDRLQRPLDPFDPGWGVEVAYFLHPAAWRQGYASELVAFCVAEARRLRLCAKLTPFAHPGNLASQRVLTRPGFVAERFVPEMARWVYGLELAG